MKQALRAFGVEDAIILGWHYSSQIAAELAKNVFQLHGVRRAQLLEQRTATVNALRGHLAEFAIIAPVRNKNVCRLKSTRAAEQDIPALVTEMADLHFDRIDRLTREVEALTAKVRVHSKQSDTARRLQSIPGVGPIAAMFIEAFAPDMTYFKPFFEASTRQFLRVYWLADSDKLRVCFPLLFLGVAASV